MSRLTARRFLAVLVALWLGIVQALAVCTLDPSNIGSNIALSNGNLTWTSSTTSGTSGAATAGAGYVGGTGSTNASNLLYMEESVGTTSGSHGVGFGISTNTPVLTGILGTGSGGNVGIGLYADDTVVYNNAGDGTLFSVSNGAVVGMAVDFFHQKVWWTSDGVTWNNDVIGNQNPATNTGGKSAPGAPFGSSGAYTTVVPAFGNSGTSGNSATFNFTGPFLYAIPSGFSAWCVAPSPGRAGFFHVSPP